MKRNDPTWDCKVGIRGEGFELPPGADLPMREAVCVAFKEIVGVEPEFCFSGWGAKLTVVEQSVVDNVVPRCSSIVDEMVSRIEEMGLADEVFEALSIRKGGET